MFKECSELFSLFKANPKLPANLNLIRSRSCGINSNGKPLVCCSSPTLSTTTTTMKSSDELLGRRNAEMMLNAQA